MNCLKCNFFYHDKQLKGEVNGDCRFDPPNPNGFPSVKSSWWCGKFKKKVGKFKPRREAGFW